MEIFNSLAADFTATPADHWANFIGHAAWQGALVGLVVLAIVALTRKLSSHFYYWVMVLALVKFVCPPFMTLPTGAFSMISINGLPAAARGAEARRTLPVLVPDAPLTADAERLVA